MNLLELQGIRRRYGEVTALDDVIATSGYQNRSEAIRDLTRAGIAQVQERTNDAQAGVAALVYVYDHRDRELPKRLTRSSHEHMICRLRRCTSTLITIAAWR